MKILILGCTVLLMWAALSLVSRALYEEDGYTVVSAPAAPTKPRAKAPSGPTSCVGELSREDKLALETFGTRALGADRAATVLLPDASIEEMVCTGLNLNGKLAARIVEIRKAANEGRFIVTCVEYRTGEGLATYLIDSADGKAYDWE